MSNAARNAADNGGTMLFFRREPKIVVSALIGISLCLFPFVAFGQDVAAEPQAWWVTVLVGFLVTFSTAIGGLLTMAIRKGMAWLDEMIKNEYISGMIQRATPVVENLVDKHYRAFVRPLKKSGKWNEQTAKEAKAAVEGQLRILWGTEGAKKLAHILGAPETAEEWVGGLVERAVTARKTSGRRAKALKAANPSKG